MPCTGLTYFPSLAVAGIFLGLLTIQAVRPHELLRELDPDSDNASNATAARAEEGDDGTDDGLGIRIDFTAKEPPGIELTEGAGHTSIVKKDSNPTRTRRLDNYTVAAIDERNVEFVSPAVLNPLWAKLANGTENYRVTFLHPESGFAHRVLLGIGIFPAAMTVYVAFCTLPCLLSQLARKGALVSVKPDPDTPAPAEASEDLTAPAATTPTHRSGLEGEGAQEPPAESPEVSAATGPAKEAHMQRAAKDEERLLIEMRPAYMLGDSPFARCMKGWYTQALLGVFLGTECAAAVIFHVQLLADEPLMVGLDLAMLLLRLGCCVAVVVGLRAVACNHFLEESAECPRLIPPNTLESIIRRGKLGKEKELVEIQGVLGDQLRFLAFAAFLPTLLLTYGFIGRATWKFLGAAAKFLTSQDAGEALLAMMFQEMDDINQQGLLYLLFFMFMLEASVVARTVQAHVDVLTTKIDIMHRKEKEEFDRAEGKDGISKRWLNDMHKWVVKLAEEVLPHLKGLSGPTCAFAVCNWTLAFVKVFLNLTAADEAQIIRSGLGALVAVFAIHLPVGLLCLLPLAMVSDACDVLQEKLNLLRGVSEPADNTHIQLTESYMKGANRGQGLGFELYGTGMVVNKRVLFTTFAKIAGAASLVLSAAYQIFKLQRGYRAALVA